MCHPSFATSSFWFLRFLAAALFLIHGVAISQGAEDKDYAVIVEGSEWTVNVEYFGGSVWRPAGTAYGEVGTTVRRNEKTYFRVEEVGGGIARRLLMRIDAKGWYEINEDDPNAVEQRRVALPLRVGSTWEWERYGKRLKATVVGLESVTIGNKTYEDCYHVRVQSTGEQFFVNYWHAPFVGQVKSVVRKHSGEMIRTTLREFKFPQLR